jgi:tetratricopeptide (TPR) repeat protein
MKVQTTVNPRADLVSRTQIALQRRHTRQAEKLAERLIRDDPADPEGIALLAQAVAARGQMQRAVRLLRQGGADDNPDLSLVLGGILATAGRWEEARQAYVSGLKKRPQETRAWLELAALLRRQGSLTGAAEAYANAIRADPVCQQGYLRLGELLQQGRSWERALAVYREGLKVMPRSPELLCHLGAALLSTHQVDKAIEALTQSLGIKPVNDAALYNLGCALLERGDFEAAECRFEQLLRLRPLMADGWYRKALCRRQGDTDLDTRDRLQALVESDSLDEDGQARILFALGKTLDDQGQHDLAFDALARANAIRKQQHAHDPTADTRLTNELIEVFQPELVRKLCQWPERGRELVFLVGLPRSGVTLLDQVLGGHSKIATLGSHDGMSKAKAQLFSDQTTDTVGYPAAITHINPDLVHAVAVHYLRNLPVRAPLITDRSLTNAGNLGLIKLLFPAARILLLERDPRDCALSMYFNDLGDGYAFDLQHIQARQQDYQRLIQHWQSLWPEDFQVVRYEDLVADLESTASQALGFLGLHFEPVLMSFTKRRNAVKSTSSWRVRQPMDLEAVGRWQEYRDHLGPLG